MALIECPECHGTVSDAAAACPHCGFPIHANVTDADAGDVAGAGGVTTLSPEQGEAILRQVRVSLKSAGLDGVFDQMPTNNARVTTRVFTSGPVVTTSTSTTSDRAPTAVPFTTSSLVGLMGYDYRSKATILGVPLLAVSRGYDPATGRKRVSRGIIAIGDVAVGVLAIGGAAFGGVTLGGLSVGFVSVGGLAVGVICALGGAAIGGIAVGGAAVGVYAFGGAAAGMFALDTYVSTHR